MPYKTLDKFLENHTLNDLMYYDFKNESPWDDVNNEENPLSKFESYKRHNMNRIIFDCDNSNGSCPFSGDIYFKLWGWNYKNKKELHPSNFITMFSNKWSALGSDTINSFQKTYVHSKNFLSDADIRANIYLHKFAKLTHCIGNFTLVPSNFSETHNQTFNQYRSTCVINDYFDLSLKLLKDSLDEAMFKDYIDTFFLNVYVDDNYNIIPLFAKHEKTLLKSHKNIKRSDVFPENKEELNEFLINVINKIEYRSRIIIYKLKNYYKTRLNCYTNCKNFQTL